jgi:uncharacterized protein YuzE
VGINDKSFCRSAGVIVNAADVEAAATDTSEVDGDALDEDEDEDVAGCDFLNSENLVCACTTFRICFDTNEIGNSFGMRVNNGLNTWP